MFIVLDLILNNRFCFFDSFKFFLFKILMLNDVCCVLKNNIVDMKEI